MGRSSPYVVLSEDLALLLEIATIEAALDDPEHYDLTGYPDNLSIKNATLAIYPQSSKIVINKNNTKILGINDKIAQTPPQNKKALM